MSEVVHLNDHRKPKSQADRHVGEIHLYQTPEGRYYFVHTGTDNFDQDIDIARALRASANAMGYHLTQACKDFGIDPMKDDHGLYASISLYHSGQVSVSLTPHTGPLTSETVAWLERRFNEAKEAIAELSADRENADGGK